jgi:hypothetical protein
MTGSWPAAAVGFLWLPRHNDRHAIGVLPLKPAAMVTAFHRLLLGFERFAAWFDHRFGWFFTNGMKQRHSSPKRPVRA